MDFQSIAVIMIKVLNQMKIILIIKNRNFRVMLDFKVLIMLIYNNSNHKLIKIKKNKNCQNHFTHRKA